jgi:hypothetical protein
VRADSVADEKGNPVPTAHYSMSPDWPAEALVTVTCAEHEGRAKLTLRRAGVSSGTARESAEPGWTESLDRLAEDLAKA